MTWPIIPLGQAVVFKGGGTPNRASAAYWGGAIPWATVKDLNTGNELRATQDSITEEGLKRSASNLIPAGTVVISTRMALGKAVMTSVDAAINQDLKAVIPAGELEPRYLLWFLIANSTRIEAMGKGATVKGVTLDQLRALEIPLPPPPEQRRIAAILDKADALRAKRREAISKLDQLLNSVFLEMFGDPVTNPKEWPKYTLGEVSEFHAGNSLPDAVEYSGQDGGFLALKVSDMNLPGNEEFISTANSWVDGDRRGAIKCPVGAVLFPKRGGAIGTNKKRVLSRPAYLDPNLMGVSASPKQMNPAFLLHWFKQFNLSDIASGSSVPQLNKRDLDPLVVHLPLLAVQQKFAAFAEQVEQQNRKMQASLAKLDGQFASLQHHIFAGEF